MPKIYSKTQHGFTLIEMAIVLIIFGLILAALLTPLQAQRELQARRQTEETLENAKKALLGFAQVNGRLPCPATVSGEESPIPVTGTCSSTSGFLPAATLGIQPTNQAGQAIDGWNNPIRYAVTTDNSSGFGSPRTNPTQVIDATHPACGGSSSADFTALSDIAQVGLGCLVPNLRVCSDSTSCSAATNLTNNAVAVIFSTGQNGGLPDVEVGDDEAANKTATTTFYSRTPQVDGSAQEFDDIVTWISPFVLYQAMIEAGHPLTR